MGMIAMNDSIMIVKFEKGDWRLGMNRNPDIVKRVEEISNNNLPAIPDHLGILPTPDDFWIAVNSKDGRTFSGNKWTLMRLIGLNIIDKFKGDQS